MKPCDRLLFGTAGTPHSAIPRDSATACYRLAELGLDAMELEYVRGSFPGKDRCETIRAAACENGIRLTAHGPYYINLNSQEPDKQEASRERIRKTAYLGGLSGVESITFHAGFFLNQDPAAVYTRICDELRDLVETTNRYTNPVDIRPETTGKPTQFGSLEELLRCASDVPGIRPCIDWSHLHARSGGCNTATDFQAVLDSVRTYLGDSAIGDMHMHLSGIAYGPKGEQNHLNLEESDINWRDLLRICKNNDVHGIIICESPSIEDDARILKDFYYSL